MKTIEHYGKEELLMLTYGKYKPEDYPKTVHGQKELILHIDNDPVNPEDGHCAYLALDQIIWMTTHRGEHMDMRNAITVCPDNARIFVGGLGLGLILLYLARAGKAREVIIAEINPYVIKVIEPRLRWWFSEYYPDFNWRVVQGDAEVEIRNHGKFDWIFWDIWAIADFKQKASGKYVEISKPYLTEKGVITTWHDLAKLRRNMKGGFDFGSYQNHILTGNVKKNNLRIRRITAIEKEKGYWDSRYAQGLPSGRPLSEVSERIRLLWSAIESELPEINHIIDVGCGDLKRWGERDCQDYIGIDIVKQICQENRDRRPHWKFICAPAEVFISELKRENVFCFELIFHIMDPRNVKKILHNLCRYASKRIFIYTWSTSPFHPEITDGKYQMYHPMGKYLPLFNEMGFELVSIELIEQPSYSLKELLTRRKVSESPQPHWAGNTLYIFKRKSEYDVI